MQEVQNETHIPASAPKTISPETGDRLRCLEASLFEAYGASRRCPGHQAISICVCGHTLLSKIETPISHSQHKEYGSVYRCVVPEGVESSWLRL